MKNNRSIQRCLALLRAFGQLTHPTLAELSAAIDLPRPTVLRFLQTLEEEGYVARDGTRWRLAPKTLELGFAALASMGVHAAVQRKLQELAEACSGTANLGQGDGERVVLIGRAMAPEERRRLIVMNLRVGSTLPRQASALGMALDCPDGGHALLHYPESNHVSLAVPLKMVPNRALTLGISAAISEYPNARVEAELLPILEDAARHIGKLLSME
jgi:IclR family pca regulon transcriptional regulator